MLQLLTRHPGRLNVWPSAEDWHHLIRGNRRGVGPYLARAGLRFISVPYGLAARAKNTLFDHGWKRVHREAVPVVSIGNLTLGGTGKTPCVEYVARFYRDLGRQVAILSRGYGSEAGRNDEAMVLEENLPDVPHLQGADRAALAAAAVEELESEVLVLDDGFQHRRLSRNLDIVLIDATRPLSREYVFPRGMLREPIGGLRRADAVVLTRCDQVSESEVREQQAWLAVRFPGKPMAAAVHAPVELIGLDSRAELKELHGRHVGGFCGIGNPAAFHKTLADLNADITAFRAFPDHHAYTRADVEDLRAWAATLPADAVIATTQKDFVKLQIADLAGRPVWAVRVGMRFTDGEEAFRELLRQAVVADRSD